MEKAAKMLAGENDRKPETDQRFRLVNLVTQRSYSHEFTVKDDNDKAYIVKKLQNRTADLARHVGVLNMKELHFMTNVCHPYIPTALEVYFEDPCPDTLQAMLKNEDYDRLFFLTEKYDYSCKELVENFRGPVSHVKRAMFHITCAVQHLHNQGIIHRDLEPRNFLCYYKAGILTTKLSKSIHNSFKDSNTGISSYMAPELLMKAPLEPWNKSTHPKYPLAFRTQVRTLLLIKNRKGHPIYRCVNKDVMLIIFQYMGFNAIEKRYCGSTASDIWALGCSFFELVSRQLLFKGGRNSEVLKLITAKRGPDRPKDIRALLGLNNQDRKLFDTPIVDNLANPGLLRDFCDLLDKMLCFDLDRRISINGVLGHPFFAEFLVSNPHHFNLLRPCVERKGDSVFLPKPAATTHIFPKQHPNWKIGFDTFIGMHYAMGNRELNYLIRFHGLDIYNRYLLEIQPVDDSMFYKRIAWCSAYIASKYFLDEISPFLWDLFSEGMTMAMTNEELVCIENVILRALKFEIYRPTCFTYLRDKNFSSMLFALMSASDIYDRPIETVMDKFNDVSF